VSPLMEMTTRSRPAALTSTAAPDARRGPGEYGHLRWHLWGSVMCRSMISSSRCWLWPWLTCWIEPVIVHLDVVFWPGEPQAQLIFEYTGRGVHLSVQRSPEGYANRRALRLPSLIFDHEAPLLLLIRKWLSRNYETPTLKRPGDVRIIATVPRTDVASRVIAAPNSAVYSALLDPEALSEWVPPGDMTGTIERFDPRPGGTYRMVLTYPEHSLSRGKTSKDTDVVEAQFTELVLNERVVYSVKFVSDDPSYDGVMSMRWEVTDTEGGTLVEIFADNVPDAVSSEDHAAGMNSSLKKLSDYLTR